MNLGQNFRCEYASARAIGGAVRSVIIAAVLSGLSATACAGAFDGAMGNTSYVVMSGDINGDGQNDVLFKAVPKLVMLPFDDDLIIPIRIPSPSPTFALVSTAYGQYALVVNPDAQTVAREAWKPATQQITYYGAEGAFAASVAIRATSSDQANFVISMSAASGQLQISSVTAPLVNNTPPPTPILPSCD